MTAAAPFTLDPTRLCQIELRASDMQRALAFYEGAFGWNPVPAELHNYVVLDVPEHCPFGIAVVPGRLPNAGAGGGVMYFGADDPEALLANIQSHGGHRVLGPTSLAGYGTIWQFDDTEGNRFGLYKSKPIAGRD
jgi:uncharacterized protein